MRYSSTVFPTFDLKTQNRWPFRRIFFGKPAN